MSESRNTYLYVYKYINKQCYFTVTLMIFIIKHELYLASCSVPPPQVKNSGGATEIKRQSYLSCGVKICENSSRKLFARKATKRPVLSQKVIPRQTSSRSSVTSHQVAAHGTLYLVRDTGRSVTPDLSRLVPSTYTSTW